VKDALGKVEVFSISCHGMPGELIVMDSSGRKSYLTTKYGQGYGSSSQYASIQCDSPEPNRYPRLRLAVVMRG
jgi:hypothetical protein